jgi:hypothetical protein
MPLHVIEQFPHCDAAILHAPGACDVCDAHPDWQQLRQTWSINFTGENDPSKIPCPSTRRRSLNDVHHWPNNRPKHAGDGQGLFEGLPTPPEPPPKTAYDHLRESNLDEASFTEDDD